MLQSKGIKVIEVGVNADGIIDVGQLSEAVSEKTALVSIQWVNNETGAIQPMLEACEIAHRNGALFHCDAAQAFGKIPIEIKDIDSDLITITAHKICGPQGCGALYAKNLSNLTPIIGGGEQEQGLRGGVEARVPLAKR